MTAFGALFDRVRETSPLVHCISNLVSANDCANIVLAAGASPIMADDPEEVEEITALSRALCLSLGTPNPRKAEAMVKAGRTAARLGLRFSDGSFKILTLSDVNEGTGNTKLGDTVVGSGKVLTYDDNAKTVKSADDPAIALADVQIPPEGGKGKTVITELNLNETYNVDVYFYLEGCDPDCISDKVALSKAALNLAFYGLLTY